MKKIMIFLDIFLHVQLLVKATQCPLVSGSCAARFNYQYVAISSMVVVSHLIHKGFFLISCSCVLLHEGGGPAGQSVGAPGALIGSFRQKRP